MTPLCPLIDQTPMHPLDQLDGQSIARLAPGGVRELLVGQSVHSAAGDVAMSDLPNEPAEGVAGCEDRVAEGMIVRASERVDVIHSKQPRRVVPHTSQRQIKASHPWPPVEE